MHSRYLLPKICILSRGMSSLECPLREVPPYLQLYIQILHSLAFLYNIQVTIPMFLNTIHTKVIFITIADIA